MSHGNLQADTLRDPDLGTLESVIISLPPMLARLALHSILLEGDTPRRTLAEQHWDRLLEAAERPGADWACSKDGEAHMQELRKKPPSRLGKRTPTRGSGKTTWEKL